MQTRVSIILCTTLTLVACSKSKPESAGSASGSAVAPTGSATAPTAVGEVAPEQRTRAAALVGELKKSLLQRLTQALAQGVPAAIEACHTDAPSLTAAVAREGAVVGRATAKPRNPKNEATGWQAEALAHFEKLKASGTALQGQAFARVLPDGRIAYAEPLVIQELCVTCHGASIAPEVQQAIAAKYPSDRATGYAVGDLRGVAWAELPK